LSALYDPQLKTVLLCSGPIWPGLSTDHRLSYWPLLL